MNYLKWNLENQNNQVKMILHVGNQVIAEKILNKAPSLKEKLAFREANGGKGAVSFEYL